MKNQFQPEFFLSCLTSQNSSNFGFLPLLRCKSTTISSPDSMAICKRSSTFFWHSLEAADSPPNKSFIIKFA